MHDSKIERQLTLEDHEQREFGGGLKPIWSYDDAGILLMIVEKRIERVIDSDTTNPSLARRREALAKNVRSLDTLVKMQVQLTEHILVSEAESFLREQPG